MEIAIINLYDLISRRTASVGFGQPMHDTMSLLIIIIISCGLGLPVLLIVFGGIGVVIKKHRERNASPYRSIN